jgi:16S rRNA (uracil1498-N3)-methyltransferase
MRSTAGKREAGRNPGGGLPPGAPGGPGQPSPTGSRPPVFLAGAGELAADRVLLTGPEGRHAADVRRLGAGERVDLTDGTGLLAECVVTRAQRGQLELAVLGRRMLPVPQPAVVAVQAIPKGDRGPLAVELLTEVGADVIVPWAAQRCVARWQGERGERALARWRSTAREAAKQARRSRIPEVSAPAGLDEVVARCAAAACAVLLDPGAPAALADLPLPGSGDVVLIAGPEGGVSPGEAAALVAAGAAAAHLGPTVLRASTAAAVAAAVVLSRSARWGEPPGD